MDRKEEIVVGVPVRLRMLREKKRPIKSMTVTADLIGIPKSTYMRYERGENDLRLYDAMLIADYYGISLDWLAGR